jgi:AraC-like DNA-binding protein
VMDNLYSLLESIGEEKARYCEFVVGPEKNTLPKSDFLGLVINMHNTITCRINGGHAEKLPNDHYNLVFLPAGSCSLTTKLEYSLFVFEFSLSYLTKQGAYFKTLIPFLEKVRRNEVSFLFNHHPKISLLMKENIHEIKNLPSTGIMQRRYQQLKYFELLMVSLNIQTEYDISSKIKKAKEYILKNIQYSFTVEFLADMVGLKRQKLQYYFKKAYGTTVWGFVLTERMKLANTYLQDSDMTLKRNTGTRPVNCEKSLFNCIQIIRHS